MAKDLHLSQDNNAEGSDWRPWIILTLLAIVIVVALLTY
jgi:hypothetical protein